MDGLLGVTLGHKYPSIIEPRLLREMNTSGGQELLVDMSAIARVIKISQAEIFDQRHQRANPSVDKRTHLPFICSH